MLVRIGGTKVVVKPATIVLLGAIITGVIAVPILMRDPAQKSPEFGYANPQGWRFETKQGAEATAVALNATATESKGTEGGLSVLDADSGFKIEVSKTGPRADSVYLRNAINLDVNQERRPMQLVFEARSGEEGSSDAAPFPVTFTLRDGRVADNTSPLWSKRVEVGPSWQPYTCKIEVKQSALLNVVLAGHLGEKTGTLQIRKMRVIDEPTGQ